MIKQLLFIVLLLISITGFCQQKQLNAQQAIVVKNGVLESAKLTKTIVTNFVQAKHLSFLSKDIISKGSLIFKDPNFIKWSYTSPFKYSVIFKENELLINDAGKKSNVDLSSTKMFKQLNGLIAKSIKGDMFDEDKFYIQYYKIQSDYVVMFTSKDTSEYTFIKKFELTFEPKNYQVIKIKMIESEEDFTLITFKDRTINKIVKDEVFSH